MTLFTTGKYSDIQVLYGDAHQIILLLDALCNEPLSERRKPTARSFQIVK